MNSPASTAVMQQRSNLVEQGFYSSKYDIIATWLHLHRLVHLFLFFLFDQQKNPVPFVKVTSQGYTWPVPFVHFSQCILKKKTTTTGIGFFLERCYFQLWFSSSSWKTAWTWRFPSPVAGSPPEVKKTDSPVHFFFFFPLVLHLELFLFVTWQRFF